MSEAPRKPFYSAALLDPEALVDRNRDFTSLAVAFAPSAEEAISLAMTEGRKWLLAHGIDRAGGSNINQY
jgi:hypothetical protein